MKPGEMTFWQGVVEDRIDPLMLGRCRVRVLGAHTSDKELIPTEDLPWAYPSQSITSAAMSGIGHTPMGPVEGTWVFGFWRDGENQQEPVMVGTFGGIPQEGATPSLGFNDPKGRYPLLSEFGVEWPLPNSPEAMAPGGAQPTMVGKPDTNSLARGSGILPVGEKNGEQHTSLVSKRAGRELGVPTGVAAEMKESIGKSGNTGMFEKAPWNEPNPRYGGVEDDETEYEAVGELSSQYPHNHVRAGESGHIEEWDDTPGAERLHTYHTSGTFEEIQSDGTKIVKVVGNNYEITAGGKNVLIEGAVNVTIGNDCRMLFQGDLVQEIYGDYHLNIWGDMRTKIKGNEAREVINNRKTIINIDDDLLIGKDALWNIGGDQLIDVGKTLTYTVNDNTQMFLLGTGNNITSAGTLGIASAMSLDLNAALNLGISCGINMDITSVGIMTLDNISMITRTTGVNWITNLISVHNSSTLHKITGLPIMLN